jgi:hypothetical protein
MFYSHQFSRPETLTRACFWLSEFGIKPFQIQIDHDACRLNLLIGRGDSIEVESIINALESADPKGQPGVWEVNAYPGTTQLEAPPGSDPATPSRSPISWHPDERHSTVDRGLGAMIEAMQGAS